jgi:hypothetical protein
MAGNRCVEGLAVIGDNGHHGLRQKPPLAQMVQQLSDIAIDIIQRVAIAVTPAVVGKRRIPSGRVVRVVWVAGDIGDEERTARFLIDPLPDRLHGLRFVGTPDPAAATGLAQD